MDKNNLNKLNTEHNLRKKIMIRVKKGQKNKPLHILMSVILFSFLWIIRQAIFITDKRIEYMIKSFVFQILTDEDDSSPIFSASSGTIFHSSNLFIPRPAKNHLKAVKYVVTHDLTCSDFLMVISKYPVSSKICMDNFQVLKQHFKSCSQC